MSHFACFHFNLRLWATTGGDGVLRACHKRGARAAHDLRLSLKRRPGFSQANVVRFVVRSYTQRVVPGVPFLFARFVCGEHIDSFLFAHTA